MPAPPLPQPTPFTCPNCGAGLQQRAEFCPHCGARLHLKPLRSAGWTLGAVALAFGTLVFGAIGACSADVAYESLTTPKDKFAQAFLMISAPLLLVGLAGAFLCGRALWRRLGE